MNIIYPNYYKLIQLNSININMDIRKEASEIIESTIDLHEKYKSNYNPLPPNILCDLDQKMTIFKNNKNIDLFLLCTSSQGFWNTYLYKYNDHIYEICTKNNSYETQEIYYIKDHNTIINAPISPNKKRKVE